MYITTTEVMEELKEKYQCPRECLMQQRHFGVFRKMKAALLKDDKDIYDELEQEFLDGYINDFIRWLNWIRTKITGRNQLMFIYKEK